MSEFKGQLLGMILVLLVFSAVGTVVVQMFKNEANTVSAKVSSMDNTTF
jgi:hypothetical protein